MKCLFTLWGCLICIFLISCSSENKYCDPEALQYPNQQATIDSIAYQQSALACRLPKVQTFNVSNVSGSEIVAKQGTVLNIRPQTFLKADGSPIDDKVKITLLEMYQPGEVIACQLSTNGLNENKKIEPLLSEGIFFLKITYNEEPVVFNKDIQLFVPSKNKNLKLSLFHSPSCQALDCEVLWETKRTTKIFEEAYPDAAGNPILGYRTFFQADGWLSLARYNDSTEPRGTLYNKSLAGYDTSNSNTFFRYDSPSMAVGMFAKFDTKNGVFSEKYNQIPKNTAGHVIFVSKPETQFKYDASPVVAKDGKITVTRNLQSGSEQKLIAYINNL